MASKLVSLKNHELKNGMTIEISFHPSNAGIDDSNEDSDETSTHEQKDSECTTHKGIPISFYSLPW